MAQTEQQAPSQTDIEQSSACQEPPDTNGVPDSPLDAEEAGPSSSSSADQEDSQPEPATAPNSSAGDETEQQQSAVGGQPSSHPSPDSMQQGEQEGSAEQHAEEAPLSPDAAQPHSADSSEPVAACTDSSSTGDAPASAAVDAADAGDVQLAGQVVNATAAAGSADGFDAAAGAGLAHGAAGEAADTTAAAAAAAAAAEAEAAVDAADSTGAAAAAAAAAAEAEPAGEAADTTGAEAAVAGAEPVGEAADTAAAAVAAAPAAEPSGDAAEAAGDAASITAAAAAEAEPGDAADTTAVAAAAVAEAGGEDPSTAAAAEVQDAGSSPTPAQAPAAPQDLTAAADACAGYEDTSHDSSSSDSRRPSKAYCVDGVRAIDVEVDCGPGLPCKLLHVTMDVSALQPSSKPYLGGFRHKQAGTLYHHASIQTPQDAQGQHRAPHKQQRTPGSDQQQQQQDGSGEERHQKLTHETQTVKEASSSCQTRREAATQMAVPGLLLDCSGDRVMTPRPYVTAQVVEQRREAAALTIQRFSRGWFARKRAGVLRGIKAERDAFLAETAAESAQATLDFKRREVERRTHPLSKADFTLLESELEAWRQQQTAAIKAAGLVPQEEQAALQLLLAKETRLLHTLDRLRVAAHHERRDTGRTKTLGALAQPKTWALSNGKKVLVHTPLTVRAAELQQLYRGLTLATLSLDERLDVLLHVKWVAKEWDCGVTRELVELIDREADLLNRGRSPKTLGGLRKRIAGMFLTCCQNPGFNPEAARLRVNAVGPNGPEAFEYVLEQQAAA